MNVIITIFAFAVVVNSAGSVPRPLTSGADSVVRRVIVEGDLVDIPEIATMFSGAEGKVVVDHVMDRSMRTAGNEAVDIREGDVVLMVSGKRIKSIADLKAIYEEAQPGVELKFGIERNHSMMLVPFTKGDPATMPRRRVVIRNGPDSGDRDVLPIPGIGIIVGEQGIVRFGNTFPEARERLGGDPPAEGDVITTINGSAAGSFASFAGVYRGLATGSRVILEITHGTATRTLRFTKPEDAGRVIINRKGGN